MCSIQFSDLSIVPLDFWHRHFLVYDVHYHKLGSCDFVGGVWYFHAVSPAESYIGLTRDYAIRSWLSYLSCAPAETADAI